MILKSMLRVALLASLGMGISASSAWTTEMDGSFGAAKLKSAKGYVAPAEDDDDEESFFSGGSNPAVPSYQAPRASFATVDVAAVCSAVLAEASTNYNQSFVDGCRKAISQKPTRRAAR